MVQKVVIPQHGYWTTMTVPVSLTESSSNDRHWRVGCGSQGPMLVSRYAVRVVVICAQASRQDKGRRKQFFRTTNFTR